MASAPRAHVRLSLWHFSMGKRHLYIRTNQLDLLYWTFLKFWPILTTAVDGRTKTLWHQWQHSLVDTAVCSSQQITVAGKSDDGTSAVCLGGPSLGRSSFGYFINELQDCISPERRQFAHDYLVCRCIRSLQDCEALPKEFTTTRSLGAEIGNDISFWDMQHSYSSRQVQFSSPSGHRSASCQLHYENTSQLTELPVYPWPCLHSYKETLL